VLAVKEGLNLPRYPSVKGRLMARKKDIERIAVEPAAGGLEKVRLRLPVEKASNVEVLGHGPEAAPKAVEVLRELELIPE
jgi:electron transfer flavoprotein beta subunit